MEAASNGGGGSSNEDAFSEIPLRLDDDNDVDDAGGDAGATGAGSRRPSATCGLADADCAFATPSGGSPAKGAGVAPEEEGGGRPNLDKVARLYEKYAAQCDELQRLSEQNGSYREQLLARIKQCDQLEKQMASVKCEHQNEVDKLRRNCEEAESQAKIARDRLGAQEQHFNRTTAQLRDTLGAQIEKLKSSSAQSQAEKEAAVIKYATRESELLGAQAERRRLNDVIQQVSAERDELESRLRERDGDEHTAARSLQAKDGELADALQKAESLESQLNNANHTIKIAGGEIEQLKRRVQQSREETDTIRSDYKDMFNQLQQTESKLLEHQQSYKADVEQWQRMYERECSVHGAAAQLIAHMRPMVDESERHIADAASSGQLAAAAVAERTTACAEAEQCRTRANELLALVQQLNERNCDVSGRLERTEEQLLASETRRGECERTCADKDGRLRQLESSLAEVQSTSLAETEPLKQRVAAFQTQVCELQGDVADRDKEVAIVKKKHIAEIKELRAELAAMKRRLAVHESASQQQHTVQSAADSRQRPSAAGGSQCSSQSHRSNNGVELQQHQQQPASMLVDGSDNVNTSPESSPPHLGPPSVSGRPAAQSAVTSPSERGARSTGAETSPPFAPATSAESVSSSAPPSRALVQKLCRLQKTLARRQEKIDFLEEHVRQLIADCQKKQKIIQMYAMREEAGTLSSPKMDAGKAELCKHNATLMSTLFGGGSSDGGRVDVHVALEVGRKLQAVLEDALLKNITLKENLETMGEEISRLSRENRSLKLAAGGE